MSINLIHQTKSKSDLYFFIRYSKNSGYTRLSVQNNHLNLGLGKMVLKGFWYTNNKSAWLNVLSYYNKFSLDYAIF